MAIDWGIVKDITIAVAAATTAGAAAVTAGVAVKGFNKWRSELTGKAHFDCARTVARHVYASRRAIQVCRSPFVMSGEFPPDFDSYNATNEQKAEAYSHAYEARFSKVREAFAELDIAALEAEALWGSPIEQKISTLRKCAIELQSYLHAYVDNERHGGSYFEKDAKFRQRTHAVVWEADDTNEFSVKLAAAIKAIEAELRGHLGRSTT